MHDNTWAMFLPSKRSTVWKTLVRGTPYASQKLTNISMFSIYTQTSFDVKNKSNFTILTNLITGRPAAHAGIVFTQWSKNGVFAPQGRHVAPINVKFGTGERTVVGIQPPKLSKFRILAINLPLRGDSFALFFYEIHSVCMRL